MPSSGLRHCSPASASTSAETMIVLRENASHRRQRLICTSDFHASQMVQPSAGGSSSRYSGCVNWNVVTGPPPPSAG